MTGDDEREDDVDADADADVDVDVGDVADDESAPPTAEESRPGL